MEMLKLAISDFWGVIVLFGAITAVVVARKAIEWRKTRRFRRLMHLILSEPEQGRFEENLRSLTGATKLERIDIFSYPVWIRFRRLSAVSLGLLSLRLFSLFDGEARTIFCRDLSRALEGFSSRKRREFLRGMPSVFEDTLQTQFAQNRLDDERMEKEYELAILRGEFSPKEELA